MAAQTRHAFLDGNTVVTVSCERFDRLMDPHTRQPAPSLAGRRIRFVTLWVDFDRGMAMRLLHVEAIWMTFDEHGRRDEDEAIRIRRATVKLLDAVSSSSGVFTRVPAAARSQLAGQRWTPTAAELDAVLVAHGLRDALGRSSGSVASSTTASDPSELPRQKQDRGHLRLVPDQARGDRPLMSSTRLNASLARRWTRWYPDLAYQEEDPWCVRVEMDNAVRDVAWMAMDKIYDELTSQGLLTGEIITFSMFPTTGASHLAYGFRGACAPMGRTGYNLGSNASLV